MALVSKLVRRKDWIGGIVAVLMMAVRLLVYWSSLPGSGVIVFLESLLGMWSRACGLERS